MGARGLEPLLYHSSGGTFEPMYAYVKPFLAATLARPVPGELGPEADTYLAVLEMQGLQPTSRYEYHRELSRLAEMYPDLSVPEITRLHVERYLVQRTVVVQRMSASSRRKIIACLSGFFGWASSAGLCPNGNPMEGIKRPLLPEPNPTAWTADEVARILAVPATPRNHLLLELLARTGQRQGDVRNVTWGQVELDQKRPLIRFGPSKGGKFHELPIQRELLHDLIVCHRLTNPQPTDWVLPSQVGKGTRPIGSTQVGRIVYEACRKAGVPKPWEPHQFRRSCATLLLEAGVEFSVVSKGILNHSSPATTMKHYRQIRRSEVADALRGLPY
jgi:integrase/recombinase XerD